MEKWRSLDKARKWQIIASCLQILCGILLMIAACTDGVSRTVTRILALVILLINIPLVFVNIGRYKDKHKQEEKQSPEA